MEPRTMDAIAPLVVMMVLPFLAGFIVWLVLTNRRRSETVRAQTEMQTRLLEKFGSSQEMLQFLQSDAGKKFLESATIEQTKPYGRIIGGTTVGIVSATVGIAVLFVSPIPSDADAVLTLSLVGGVLLALGIGFLLSSIAAYLLSKKWGLVNFQCPECGRSKTEE